MHHDATGEVVANVASAAAAALGIVAMATAVVLPAAADVAAATVAVAESAAEGAAAIQMPNAVPTPLELAVASVPLCPAARIAVADFAGSDVAVPPCVAASSVAAIAGAATAAAAMMVETVEPAHALRSLVPVFDPPAQITPAEASAAQVRLAVTVAAAAVAIVALGSDSASFAEPTLAPALSSVAASVLVVQAYASELLPPQLSWPPASPP